MERKLVRSSTTRKDGETIFKETKLFDDKGYNYGLETLEVNPNYKKQVIINNNVETKPNKLDYETFYKKEDSKNITEFFTNGHRTSTLIDTIQDSDDKVFKYTNTERLIKYNNSDERITNEVYTNDKIKIEKQYDEENELKTLKIDLYDEDGKDYKLTIPLKYLEKESTQLNIIDEENKIKDNIELGFISKFSSIYEDDDLEIPEHSYLIFKNEKEPHSTIDYEYKRDDNNRIIKKLEVGKSYSSIYSTEDEYIYDDTNNITYKNIYELK